VNSLEHRWGVIYGDDKRASDGEGARRAWPGGQPGLTKPHDKRYVNIDFGACSQSSASLIIRSQTSVLYFVLCSKVQRQGCPSSRQHPRGNPGVCAFHRDHRQVYSPDYQPDYERWQKCFTSVREVTGLEFLDLLGCVRATNQC
jgi:hypothetical protein